MANALFNRSLVNDKDGFARFSSWFHGGLARNAGFTDGDAILHDGGDGRNRFLFIEAKPTTNELPLGQSIMLEGLAKLSEAITAVVVCIPAVDSAESVGNPHFVARPQSKMHYTITDPQLNRWKREFTQTTIWEFNQMVRHWFNGNEFELVPTCSCCKWGREELAQVLQRTKRGSLQSSTV